MDTTNKHIGNVLYKMTDEDIKEVFEQYAHKLNFDTYHDGYNDWKDKMLNHLSEILYCKYFYYDGSCRFDIDD